MALVHVLIQIVILEDLLIEHFKLCVLQVESIFSALYVFCELFLDGLEAGVKFFLDGVEISEATEVDLLEVFVSRPLHVS